MEYNNIQEYMHSLKHSERWAKLFNNEKWSVEEYNAKRYPSNGIVDCPMCLNKRMYYVVDENGHIGTKICDRCMKENRNAARIHESGLEKQLERCTLDSFHATEQFQKDMLNIAKSYVETGIEDKHWFFVGGQSGCGKTHICTAIVGEILKNTDYDIKYVIWPQMAQELKSLVTNEERYAEELDFLQKVDVLYIDDFFKPDATKADIKLAYNIINYRYNADKTTILSTEFYTSEIAGIDEAIAGRIAEKCGEHRIDIGRNRVRNYRLQTRSVIANA